MASYQMHCFGCNKDIVTDEPWIDCICPACGTRAWRLRCNRCDHEWTLRAEQIPKFCPGCSTPYWNKERIRKKVF